MHPVNPALNPANPPVEVISPIQELFAFYQQNPANIAEIMRRLDVMPVQLRLSLLKSALMNGEVGPVNMLMQSDAFRQADLRNTLINNKDISGMNLHQANLNISCFHNCKINHGDFNKSLLFNVSFDDTEAKNINLQHCHAKNASLKNVVFDGANLSNTDFTLASFYNAKLPGVTATQTRFDQCTATFAVMSEGAFEHASFRHANLMHSDFTASNLQNTDFSHALLVYALLNGTNLNNACFDNTNLNGCEIENATLDNTRFKNISALNVSFQGSSMSNTQLDIALPANWTRATLENYFNIFDNDESLLITLGSIDEQYHPLKHSVLKKIIGSLKSFEEKFTPAVLASFLEATGRSPLLLTDPECHAFMVKVLDDFRTLPANQQKIPRYSHEEFMGENFICGILSLIESLPKEKQQDIMLNNNDFFIELVREGIITHREDDISQAQSAYLRYLALSEVNTIISHPDISPYYGNGKMKPDWSDSDFPNWVMTAESEGKQHALIFSDNIFSAMLKGEKGCWHQQYYLIDRTVQGHSDREKLFTDIFPLFRNGFINATFSGKIEHHLTELNLGEYHEHFRYAIKNTGVGDDKKLIAFTHQQRLAELLHPLLSPAPKGELNAPHMARLMAIYQLAEKPVSEQSQILLVLSAVFCRLSSSEYFGSEDDSPQALRRYAHGLLLKAHETAPEVTIGHFNHWQKRLTGDGPETSCSAMLADDMVLLAEDHFPDVLTRVYPAVWR